MYKGRLINVFSVYVVTEEEFFCQSLNQRNDIILDPEKFFVIFYKITQEISLRYFLDMMLYTCKILHRFTIMRLIPQYPSNHRDLFYNNILRGSQRDRLLAVVKAYLCQ